MTAIQNARKSIVAARKAIQDAIECQKQAKQCLGADYEARKYVHNERVLLDAYASLAEDIIE